jgi:hypothetical protein
MRYGATPPLRPLFLAAFLFVVSACGSEQANIAPTVTLDPKLENGANVHSRLTVSWIGSDPDGRIDHYEYVLDPPAAFTEEEITEGGPGIVSVRIPASNGAPTITRVSKVVNGVTVSFDWVHTKETSQKFELSSNQPDSTSSSRFQGLHALYVRAVDDDSNASKPDHVAFTSKTLAPITRVVSPESNPYSGLIYACVAQTFRWEARSRDGLVPQRFLYKLLRVDNVSNYVELPYISTNAFFVDSTEWVETDQHEVTINLPLVSEHIFAVRAVDTGGTAEPYIEWGRNALRMQVFNEVPQLTIRLFDLVIYPGPYSPYGEPKPENAVAAGVPFRLTWSAMTRQCSLDGYSWGLDLVSTDEMDRGWSTWGRDTESPILSLMPGIHTFSVRARDAAGSIGLATVTLNVLVFGPDREVLLVDDSLDNVSPNDAEHDAFWHSMIDGYAAYSGASIDQFGEFSVHGDGDRGNLQPSVPPLSDLLHYKVVIWENAGWGYNSDSALIRSTALSNRLSMYLRIGGKLWLEGRMNVAATTPDPNLAGADLIYPKTELGPGDWAWDFLKLHSSKINNDKGTNNAHLFHAARWFPNPNSSTGYMPAIYDTMSVDPTKLNIFQANAGGFSYCDAVFDPNFAESEPDFQGDIDTLYAYGAAGPEVQGKNSQYNKKVCALRWHDADPKPFHGRIQWFGFELYYMHTDQAQKTFNQSLDWFREGP